MSVVKNNQNVAAVKLGTLNIKAIYRGTLLEWLLPTTTTTTLPLGTTTTTAQSTSSSTTTSGDCIATFNEAEVISPASVARGDFIYDSDSIMPGTIVYTGGLMYSFNESMSGKPVGWYIYDTPVTGVQCSFSDPPGCIPTGEGSATPYTMCYNTTNYNFNYFMDGTYYYYDPNLSQEIKYDSVSGFWYALDMVSYSFIRIFAALVVCDGCATGTTGTGGTTGNDCIPWGAGSPANVCLNGQGYTYDSDSYPYYVYNLTTGSNPPYMLQFDYAYTNSWYTGALAPVTGVTCGNC